VASADDRLTTWQRHQLEAGEVLVEMVEIPGSDLREGVVRRVLDAPPERVFRAVRDPAHYAEFMPFVTASRATGRPGEWELSLDLPWPSPDERFRITVTDSIGAGPRGEPLWRSSWRLVPGSGDVVENGGDWTLAAFTPGRTLVTLRMRNDAGPPVPLGLQERGTRESLPWVLDGLRQHVGRCRYDEPRKQGCAE
jgi:uncharacterized protein YndB with AHSA1/START domain